MEFFNLWSFILVRMNEMIDFIDWVISIDNKIRPWYYICGFTGGLIAGFLI